MGKRKPAADAPPAASAPGNGAEAAQVLEVLTQASLLALTSALKSWVRTAELWARLAPALAQGYQDLAGEDLAQKEARAVLIDQMRAALREVAEVSGQEARQLQSDLERLFDRLRPVSAEEAGRPYRRRWNVKP